jgi:hypothetical protein
MGADARSPRAKAPKEVCMIWTHNGDAGDTVEMNLLFRKVPGKLRVESIFQSKRIVNFYEIHGVVIAGSNFSDYAVVLGDAWMYRGSTDLVLSLTMDDNSGRVRFRGQWNLPLEPEKITRTDSSGIDTFGTTVPRPCSDVVMD